MISLETATREHAISMAPRVRKDDELELLALGFKDSLDGLLQSLSHSARAFTVLHNGEPASMMGLALPNIIGRTAMPWLITTDLVERFPITHTRNAKRALAILLDEFPHIENYVDARYERTHRWLRWLGFTVHAPQPLGPNRAPFCHFEIGRA